MTIITGDLYQRRSIYGIYKPAHRVKSDPKNRLSDVGFTLIEILIALTIFSIGILSLSTLQTNAIKGNFKANRLTVAGTMASSQSELFQGLDFTAQEFSAGDHPVMPQGQFWIGWTVTDDMPLKPLTEDTNGDPMPACSISKTIDIIVFSDSQGFSNQKGDNRILTYSMIKTRHI